MEILWKHIVSAKFRVIRQNSARTVRFHKIIKIITLFYAVFISLGLYDLAIEI